MKTIIFRLASRVHILEIVQWCEDNRIPVVFYQSHSTLGIAEVEPSRRRIDGILRYSRRECYHYFSEAAYTGLYDGLLIRDCDYELVRLRF